MCGPVLSASVGLYRPHIPVPSKGTLMAPLSILHRPASRNRRITGAVAGVVVVTLAVGVGLASHRRPSAAHLTTAPLPTAQTPASLGRLAYGINGDIYVADSDGRNRVRIANGAPAAWGPDRCRSYGGEGPIWSPDGRHLAYRGAVGRTGSCRGTVIISDPAGHRVASFPGEGWLISWSPDSTRVATWVRLGDTIGVYGLDGVRQALLTVPPDSWSRATSTRCGRPTERRWWSRKGWRSPSTVPLRWFYRRTTHERTMVPRRRPTDLGSPGSTTDSPRGR